ncbi:MAG: hypothetical protein KGP01_06110, partial [Actinomycetales bacterium]|nr:hypothetical protein [Actinomycetales bacterium]
MPSGENAPEVISAIVSDLDGDFTQRRVRTENTDIELCPYCWAELSVEAVRCDKCAKELPTGSWHAARTLHLMSGLHPDSQSWTSTSHARKMRDLDQSFFANTASAVVPTLESKIEAAESKNAQLRQTVSNYSNELQQAQHKIAA